MTVWYFLRSAPGDLQPLSSDDMESFLRGHQPLPADERRLVHYIGLSVAVDEGAVMAVEAVWFGRCEVREDGTLDQQAMLARVNARLDLHRRLSTQGLVWPPGQDVVDARDAFAARRAYQETRWEPTETDLLTLRELVNRRAGWMVL